MAATPISQSSRYINAGVTKVYFLPVIASESLEPTRAEIDAGTDVSREVAELTGWQVTSGQVQTPDLATTFTGSISGRTTADDSSITFYADRTGEDIRDLLPRDTEGYIVIMDGGDVEDMPMDVYPVRVGASPKLRSVGDEAARLQVRFFITREPAENVAVPAEGG